MAETLRGRLIPLMLCCLSGSAAQAAEPLPPLFVDPSLLGPLPVKQMLRPNSVVFRPDAVPAGLAPGSRATAQSVPLPDAPTAPATDANGAVLPVEREAAALPKLRPAQRLTPWKRDPDTPRPTFVIADQVTRVDGNEVLAEGNADLRRIGNTLKADKISYWEDADEVEAVGHVRLTTNDDVITGPRMRRKFDEATGFFEQPVYTIKRVAPPGQVLPAADGNGQADRIEFLGDNLFRLINGTYSSCPAPNPDWYAKSEDMKLDFNQGEGEGKNGTLYFKDVPILHSPWLDFPLNNNRRSGLLTPSLGTTSTSGIEMTLPWYWNIAPDMDATFVPRVMTKRGVQLSTEFRYMGQNYRGTDLIEFMPNDNLTGKSRSLLSLSHTHNLGEGFSANANINKVSDDTYFTDLAKPISGITTTTTTNLERRVSLSYGASWWNTSVFVQRYQTLQDPKAPVSVPYDRLPAATLYAYRPDLLGGAAFTMNGTFDAFQVSDPTNANRANGNRTVFYPQISLPYQTSAFSLTPKIGYHVTRYSLSKVANAGDPDSLSRQLPIFSVDGSVTFERDATWFDKAATQTLEPRLFYLRVPSRDQNKIPLFDTGLADFNFAQIFSENIFVGSDRIADANQLTAALTSRVIRQNDGAEVLRMALGQRYYFRSQTVTLNPTDVPRTSSKADVLAAVSGQFIPKTWLDSAWQYNPRDAHTERFSVGGRYQPEMFKVLNASYRFQRDSAVGANDGLRDVDISGQWPLFGRWYGVGRYDFSLHDRRLVEALGGLEYDGGCWVGRVVMQRFVTSSQTSNTTLFLLLELNGFSRLGSDPLDALRRSVGGYRNLNDPRTAPIMGGPYF